MILESMVKTIQHGLARKSISSCAKWAEKYRQMGKPFPGPWGWKHHPWLLEMHNSKAAINIGRKASQMGFTEWALNRALYSIDIERMTVLYVLPNKTPDATDFSASRFTPALEMSEHLSRVFTDVDNVGHKRAGEVSLFIRGSQSRAGLKSLPVGGIVFDEVDEMNQDNIPLGEARVDGQEKFWILKISTPTREKVGINVDFMQSTKEHFFFKCPGCSRSIELVFPESLVITADRIDDPRINDSHLICTSCKKILPHESKVEWMNENNFWVPTATGFEARGWYINHMYSMAKAGQPARIAAKTILAQTSIAHEIELYNSDMGLPHTPKGSQITDEELDACSRPYSKGTVRSERLVTMGVDVGIRKNYIEIAEWILPPHFRTGDPNVECIQRILQISTNPDFTYLDWLMNEYNVTMCVIDAQPERRSALHFCMRNVGRAYMCFYAVGIRGKLIHKSEDPEPTLSVDRTSWIDMSLGRFRYRTTMIPADIGNEYRDQIKVPVRMYRFDKDGQEEAYYVSDADDHFAHAHTYNEIALVPALKIGSNQGMDSPL